MIKFKWCFKLHRRRHKIKINKDIYLCKFTVGRFFFGGSLLRVANRVKEENNFAGSLLRVAHRQETLQSGSTVEKNVEKGISR